MSEEIPMARSPKTSRGGAGVEGISQQTGSYSTCLGRRLRELRRGRGLTLNDVEARSEGEFKSGIVGAYERGQRCISLPRLQRLAKFYDVTVQQILPRDTSGTGSWVLCEATRAGPPGSGRLTMQLAWLHRGRFPEKW